MWCRSFQLRRVAKSPHTLGGVSQLPVWSTGYMRDEHIRERDEHIRERKREKENRQNCSIGNCVEERKFSHRVFAFFFLTVV